MPNMISKCAALVTGASTGIGAVYADRLAKRGSDKDSLRQLMGKSSGSAGRWQMYQHQNILPLNGWLEVMRSDTRRYAYLPESHHQREAPFS
jgi:hypothetical protein